MRSAAAPRHAGCLRGTRAGGQGREAGEQSRGKEGCGQRGRCRRMELRCRVPRGGGRRGDPAARSRRWGERGAPTDLLACDTTPTPCSDSAARAAARSRSGVLTLWRWQLKAAKRGTATFPDAGDVWEARGTVEEAAGLLDAAAASFSRALELDPGRAVAALKARTSPSPPPPPDRDWGGPRLGCAPRIARQAHASPPPPPPPLPRTKWTRRVPHLVLIGHAASLAVIQPRRLRLRVPPRASMRLRAPWRAAAF